MELLDWYVSLPARRVDLVGDYAGSELFVVEGDSLLLRCLSDPKLDFNEGFQLLHAVYAVEHFLQGLVQRKCTFHIVFFDEHEEACIPRNAARLNRNKYLLARSVIIRHLQAHLPKAHPSISLQVFKSVEDPSFGNYLKTSAVYFMLCHDGADSTIITGGTPIPDEDRTEKARVEAEERSRKLLFRGLIYSMIRKGYNVALINGLEWMDTKVMTMVVEGHRQSLPKDLIIPGTAKAQNSITPKGVEDLFAKLGFKTQVPVHQNGDTMDGQKEAPEDTFKSLTIDNQPVFSESVYLVLIALAIILRNDPSKSSLALSLLVHTALIGETSISDRPQSSTTATGEDLKASELVDEFSVVSRSILDDRSWSNTMNSHLIKCDVADLIDGRLFSSVAAELVKVSFSKENQFGWLDTNVEELIQILDLMCGVRLEYRDQKTLSNGKPKNKSGLGLPRKTESLSILPFSNEEFDKHLRPLKISVENSNILNYQSAKIFQEISHWHKAKRRQDLKSTHALSDKDKSRALRRNQFFMAEMQAYAASLTNSAGKVLDPKLITVSDAKKSIKGYIESSKDSDDSASSRKPYNPKAKANSKRAGKSSMREGIAANKATKDNESLDKLFSSWQNVRKTLESESQLSSRYLKTKTYLRDLRWHDLPESKRSEFQAEIEFYTLTILLEIYQNLSNKKEEMGISRRAELYGVAALIWDFIRKLSLTDGLTKTIADHIKQISRVMDLPTLTFPKPTSERKLTFDFDLHVSSSKDLSISLNPVDFQCLHCGPYMDRNLGSAPDSRVPFKPDAWQRRVLDELDANRSVFVVAPTSAGKTFISFYAMEKVLGANDESVLVYVAPTKALVNQIAAEVQARYKKSYKHAGTSVWAVHTRDAKINNSTGCQILVTVPHILQIMLLEPSNAKSWSKNVKTIIFDEIHSIGNADDGVIWEQLLLLAPCPIIALSATVGNPEKFSEWLAATQKSSGFELTMIKHQHRYSDLRKFSFTPPKRFTFSGLSAKSAFATLGLDGVDGFSFIHPVASLVNKSRGMPDDLSLEARDCLSLWQSMSKHQTPQFPVDSSLDPGTSALPKVIAKADIIKWEEGLKTLLRTWMLNDESPFDKVVEDLGKSTADHAHDQISRRHAADAAFEEAVHVSENDLFATTLPLLCKLHERDALPAIFFHYDRSKCEGICKAVLAQLVTAETRWKEKSQSWKKQLSEWEKWKKEQAKISSKRPQKAAPKKRNKDDDDDDDDGLGSKADRIQDAANVEASPFASFDPEAPVDGFHFAAKHRIESSELDRHIYSLKKRGLPHLLVDALTRGIGVHHAGMNRKYRQVVEMLFRKGYLRVVIATGTLALGINMPCATVVFSGDSVFLTALNYRQAAGRAGRRGFDLLGNVVFQNITTSKVCRLISSRLPDLNGHFPITTTLVLRLFRLLHESGNSPYAKQAIHSLLSQPRLYLDGLAFKDQVLHHLRFSIEYLRRQSLLSAQGAPLNLASLTCHLYYTENSCFALNALLKDGVFHELCSNIKEKESSVLRTLMVVMAHLFGRIPCRQADQEYIDTIVKRSPSIVFLPPLPSRAAQSLRQHNQDTLQIFTTYVKTFVDQHINTDDCTLPLTGVTVGGQGTLGDLGGKLLPTKVRSAFVALSGHGDTFDNISDLCRTTRGGVFLEEAVIPHLDVYPDEAKGPLNAYLYDFYMHGDLESLDKANGVRRSDVWFLLNDFSLVLGTITASLAKFLKLSDSDVSMADVMGEGDERTNVEDDQFAAERPSDKGESSSASTTSERGRVALPTASSLKPRSKKKVVESWEDEEMDEAKGSESANGTQDGENSEGAGSRSVEQMEEGFINVYWALSKLRAEFDTKFKAIFA